MMLVRDFLAAIKAPLLVAAFVLTYSIGDALGIVPSPQQLSQSLLTFFRQYGTIVIAPICALESLAPINTWFPAALAILTAMASTSGDPVAGLRMFFVIWASSLLGLLGSFLLGRRMGEQGHPLDARPKGVPGFAKDLATALTMFVHPYIGSLHTFRSGAQNMPWARAWIPILIAHSAWSVFWATTTYRYGLWLYEGNFLLVLIWGYLIGWLLLDAIKFVRGK